MVIYQQVNIAFVFNIIPDKDANSQMKYSKSIASITALEQTLYAVNPLHSRIYQ
jgi:hypothetical protein